MTFTPVEVDSRGSLPWHLVPVGFAQGDVIEECLDDAVEFPGSATHAQITPLEHWPDGSVRWAHAEWTTGTLENYTPINYLGTIEVIDTHGVKYTGALSDLWSSAVEHPLYIECRGSLLLASGAYRVTIFSRAYKHSPVSHCWLELTVADDSHKGAIVEASWQPSFSAALIRHVEHRTPLAVAGGKVYLWKRSPDCTLFSCLDPTDFPWRMDTEPLTGQIPYDAAKALAEDEETHREPGIPADYAGRKTTAWSAYSGNAAGVTLGAEVLLWHDNPEGCPAQEEFDAGPLGYVAPAVTCVSGAAGPISPCDDINHPVDLTVRVALKSQFELGRNLGYTGLLLDGLTPEWVYPADDRADLHRAMYFFLHGLDPRVLVAIGDIELTELFARHAFNSRNVQAYNADVASLGLSAFEFKHGKDSPSPLGLWGGPNASQIDVAGMMGHWCQPEHQRWAGILAGDMAAWQWWQGWMLKATAEDYRTDSGGRGASSHLQTAVEAYESSCSSIWEDRVELTLDTITGWPAANQVTSLATSPFWRPNAVVLACEALGVTSDPTYSGWLEAAADAGVSVGVIPLTASLWSSDQATQDQMAIDVAHYPTMLHFGADKWQGYGPVPTQRFIDQWPYVRHSYAVVTPETKYRIYPCHSREWDSTTGAPSLAVLVVHSGGPLNFHLRTVALKRGSVDATGLTLRHCLSYDDENGLEVGDPVSLPPEIQSIISQQWGNNIRDFEFTVNLSAGDYVLEVRSHLVGLQYPITDASEEYVSLTPDIAYRCGPSQFVLDSSQNTNVDFFPGDPNRPSTVEGESLPMQRSVTVPVFTIPVVGGTPRPLEINGAPYSSARFQVNQHTWLRAI